MATVLSIDSVLCFQSFKANFIDEHASTSLQINSTDNNPHLQKRQKRSVCEREQSSVFKILALYTIVESAKNAKIDDVFMFKCTFWLLSFSNIRQIHVFTFVLQKNLVFEKMFFSPPCIDNNVKRTYKHEKNSSIIPPKLSIMNVYSF